MSASDNQTKHGFDFAALTPEFFERSVIIPTKLDRWLALGRLDGSRVTATLLGREAISVVSMRSSSKKERPYAP